MRRVTSGCKRMGDEQLKLPRRADACGAIHHDSGGGGTRTPKGVSPADFESAALPIRLRLQRRQNAANSAQKYTQRGSALQRSEERRVGKECRSRWDICRYRSTSFRMTETNRYPHSS